MKNLFWRIVTLGDNEVITTRKVAMQARYIDFISMSISVLSISYVYKGSMRLTICKYIDKYVYMYDLYTYVYI